MVSPGPKGLDLAGVVVVVNNEFDTLVIHLNALVGPICVKEQLMTA